MLRFERLLVDLQRIDAAAVILISPGTELALRDAVFATRLRNGDLAHEHLEDDCRLTLGGPAFELLRFGLRLGRRKRLSHRTPSFASMASSSRGVTSLCRNTNRARMKGNSSI